ncbi:protein rapunzel-like [Clarias gariepinus]|uniref:protein rapunzel-like n=1 Tax=Clarias gariepinus TaxID=13013 RepID=UPI00234CDEEC|nr:protein rapunzel-like [Clarias gariepinus]
MAANGKEQFKESTAEVLGCVEKLFSFASTFNPMFGTITKLVNVVRKGLAGDEAHKLYQDFQQINAKLESIAEQNRQLQKAILKGEIQKNYGDMEKNIEEQYSAFKDFVNDVMNEPEKVEHHERKFIDICRKQQGSLNLKEYYRAIMGEQNPFGRPLLEVYLKHCERKKKSMEDRCAHLAYLFHIGLIALMAYCVIIKDDQNEFKKEWGQKVSDIQAKMQEALSKCDEHE